MTDSTTLPAWMAILSLAGWVVSEKRLERAVAVGLEELAKTADRALAHDDLREGHLTGEGHENKTYELGGDEAWSFAEYAAELSRQTGKEIVYNSVPVEAYKGILTGAGLPEPLAAILAGVDASIEKGELVVATGDLSRLTGRPTTPIAESIAAALKG